VADSINYHSDVIAEIINKNFIPVKFDAASINDFTFFGKTYKTGGQYNPHGLIRAYLKQNYQMPALLFINNKGQAITEIHGFIPPAVLESVLSYFAGNAYQKTKFDAYRKTFKNKIKY
jgi:thioredoxin-related protein